LGQAQQGLDELRQLAAGVHPAVLTTRGLGPAVEALADRVPIPVLVHASSDRYPPHVESAAYFLIAEAITNAVKHADASRVLVRCTGRPGALDVVVEDDGRGGADPDGAGLRGIADRVEALGGTMTIDSPRGAGTRLWAAFVLPLTEPTRVPGPR
jgi:signal transduction histidine kinase